VAPNGTIFDTYLPTYRKYEDSLDPKRKPYDVELEAESRPVKVDRHPQKRDDQTRAPRGHGAALCDLNGTGHHGVKVPRARRGKWRLNMFRWTRQRRQKAQTALGWSAPLGRPISTKLGIASARLSSLTRRRGARGQGHPRPGQQEGRNQDGTAGKKAERSRPRSSDPEIAF